MPQPAIRPAATIPFARCPASIAEYEKHPREVRDAYRAFFFTEGFSQFWGANSHNEGLVRALHQLVPRLVGQSVIDAGAGRYNTIGGDISHFILFNELWGSCPGRGGVILGFEPVPRQHKKLSQELNRTFFAQASSGLQREGEWAADRTAFATFENTRRGRRRCAHLSAKALSDHIGSLPLANMPFAGDNTASLDDHYHHDSSPLVKARESSTLKRMSEVQQRLYLEQRRRQRQQLMRPTVTLDAQLDELHALEGSNAVLLFKVDVSALRTPRARA
jgi:hypothetical protein